MQEVTHFRKVHERLSRSGYGLLEKDLRVAKIPYGRLKVVKDIWDSVLERLRKYNNRGGFSGDIFIDHSLSMNSDEWEKLLTKYAPFKKNTFEITNLMYEEPRHIDSGTLIYTIVFKDIEQ